MTNKYPAWIYHTDNIHVCQLKSHYDLGPGIPQKVSSFTPQNRNFGPPRGQLTSILLPIVELFCIKRGSMEPYFAGKTDSLMRYSRGEA